jgi:predicted nucleic acid-binding protein
LIDTGVLIANYSAPDVNHARAVELVNEVARGIHGRAYITDYILAETLNFVVNRSRNPKKADEVARDLLGEQSDPWLDFAWIDEGTWRIARDRFRLLSLAGMSFTDCTSFAFVERNRLAAIMSFDAGFDRVLTRFH